MFVSIPYYAGFSDLLGVMDSYKSTLYTSVFQDENFPWRPGLGFSRLGDGDDKAILIASKSTDLQLQLGLRL